MENTPRYRYDGRTEHVRGRPDVVLSKEIKIAIDRQREREREIQRTYPRVLPGCCSGPVERTAETSWAASQPCPIPHWSRAKTNLSFSAVQAAFMLLRVIGTSRASVRTVRRCRCRCRRRRNGDKRQEIFPGGERV